MVSVLASTTLESNAPRIIIVQGNPFPTDNYEIIRVYFSRGLGLNRKWVDILRRAAVSCELNRVRY